jgi:hypothetical protein
VVVEASLGLPQSLQQQHSRHHLRTTSSARHRGQSLCWVAYIRAR